MADVTLKIDGNDKSSLLQDSSLELERKLNGVSSGSLTIRDEASGYEPCIGNTVTVEDTNDNKVFGGEIDRIRKVDRDNKQNWLFYELELVDFQEIAARRVIDAEYNQETAGSIVKDLIDKVLSQDGVTEGIIETDDTLAEVDFHTIYVSEALDKLSDRTGLQWWIDADKQLNFRSIFANDTIDDLTEADRDIVVDVDRADYRNRQVVKGDGRESGKTKEITEKITVDNKNNRVRTRFPIQDLIEIDPGVVGLSAVFYPELSADEFTVGVGFNDQIGVQAASIQWRWEEGSRTLTRNSVFDGGLDIGDVVTVTYEAQADISVVVDSPERQNERQDCEDNTAIHTHIERQNDLGTEQEAKSLARGLLEKHGSIDPIVEFRRVENIVPGDTVPIDLPDFNLTERTGIVERVRIEDVGRADGKLERVIKVNTGKLAGGWEKFFQEIYENESPLNDSKKITSEGVANEGGFDGYQDELDKEDGERGIDGDYVWFTRGLRTDRHNFKGEKLGELNLGGQSVTVGSNALYIGNSFGEIDKINDPIKEEDDVSVTIDEQSNPLDLVSADFMAYSNNFSSTAGRVFLWVFDGSFVNLVDFDNASIARSLEVDNFSFDDGEPIWGIAQANKGFWLIQHDNFDFSFNARRIGIDGVQQEKIFYNKDREFDEGLEKVKSQFWVQEASPEGTLRLDQDGEIIGSFSVKDYNDIGSGYG